LESQEFTTRFTNVIAAAYVDYGIAVFAYSYIIILIVIII
jgi:hypothetical protein